MVKRDIYQEIKEQPKRGVLIVLAGPSGAGKDVLIDELMKEDGRVIRLVTTTTRLKRVNEVDGRDYHFIDRASFEKLIVEDKFFEWVEYRGHLYGGQKKHVEEALKSGSDVLWRIDVKGVKNIKDKVRAMISDPKSVINLVAFVFLTGPTLAVMEERMKKRGTESVGWQRWSKDVARWEMEQFEDFDYLVVNYNNHLSDAVAKVKQIIEVERMRIAKNNF